MKNILGNNLTVTIFGESHGSHIGAVIDGLTAGIKVDEDIESGVVIVSTVEESGVAKAGLKKGDVITLEATFTSLNSGNVYNVTITTGAKISTAVENVEVSASPVKMIENGQLIVIKNGVKYNALGQEIK